MDDPDSNEGHILSEFFAPVGKAMVLFNHLDHLLILITGGLCVNEFVAVSDLMADASFGRKVKAFICICRDKVKKPELLEDIEQVVKAMCKAERDRNRVAHTIYMRSSDDQLFSLKWNPSKKKERAQILQGEPLKMIEEAANSAEKATLELLRISDELNRAGHTRMTLGRKLD